MHHGWYLAAFESELTGAVSRVTIGTRELVAVAGDDGVGIFDAVCPHRGAHLGIGGRLAGDAIVCPFHGHHIHLGRPCDEHALGVRRYHSLGYGGMIFVRDGDERDGGDRGLEALLDEICETHVFVPCHTTTIDVSGPVVIENAFDEHHFATIHGVRNQPQLEIEARPGGPLTGTGPLVVPISPWQRGSDGGDVTVPFAAHAFSPDLVLSHLGGGDAYWVITGTVPHGSGCLVRQAVAVPASVLEAGELHARPRLEFLVKAVRGGLEQDRVVWEHLAPDHSPAWCAEDASVLAFRDFCATFVAGDEVA